MVGYIFYLICYYMGHLFLGRPVDGLYFVHPSLCSEQILELLDTNACYLFKNFSSDTELWSYKCTLKSLYMKIDNVIW